MLVVHAQSTVYLRVSVLGAAGEQQESDKRGAPDTHHTATRSHQQREPDLDVLAPITSKDYKPAPPPCITPSTITCTVIGVGEEVI